MNYSMLYHSITGNTKLLAETIEETCAELGLTKAESTDAADLVFIGFWTQDGDADKKTLDEIKYLKDKKAFLFGSCGFGDSKPYFDGILEVVEGHLQETVDVIGSFICQGKMPQEFRNNYEKQKEVVPTQSVHYDLMISNFDKALNHPDQNDLDALKKAVKDALNSLA